MTNETRKMVMKVRSALKAGTDTQADEQCLGLAKRAKEHGAACPVSALDCSQAAKLAGKAEQWCIRAA